MVAVHASIRDGKEPALQPEVETQVVWHIRGYFWDKLATEWAGKEDWMSKRKKTRQNSLHSRLIV